MARRTSDNPPEKRNAAASAFRVAEDAPRSPSSGVPGPRMRFVHQRRRLYKGEIVQLDCDTQCNFMLLSDADYVAYQRIRRFKYSGGTFKKFPARISVPETGDWNIIIDFAGAKGEIRHNITIVVE